MTTDRPVHSLDLSRRGLLRGAALVAGGGALLAGGLMAPSAEAATKLTQQAANYQSTPKGMARCNVCSQWLQPTDCKVVQGPVLPTGWCSLYVAKW
jgi:hypothetical protein